MTAPQSKVLITGAFATGKTSLCRRLVRQLRAHGRSVLYVGEVARTCPLPLNRMQTVRTSAWLAMKQIETELIGDSSSAEIMIVDRSLPDILSHTWAVSRRRDDKAVAFALESLCGQWCRRYSLVFLARLDPARGIATDNVRVPSKRYQASLERHIVRVLDRLKIRYVELPSTTAERERLALTMIRALRTRASTVRAAARP